MSGDEPSLTEREAYMAMLAFLEAYWERGGKESDDLAGLLGSASIYPSGMPLDQALWHDWLDAAAKVRSGKADE